MRKFGFKIITSIDESEPNDACFCCSLGADKSWLNIEHEWIEKSIGVVIVCVILSIECYLDCKHVRLRILGDWCSNVIVRDPFSLNVNYLV